MTGNDIRKRFLTYFEANGHTIVDSSSLVPHDDPTLLFANAGMNQFKRVFMGEEHRDYVRAVTSQRCVRAGGKHNDLENVGYTARHHTFFEMLGNFSFGDYFKKEAIRLAWNFLTVELGLNPEQLWASVYEEDDEAFALWEAVEDLPAGRVVRLGAADNFWAMGDTGPCGPCSEIYIDQGPVAGCDRPDCAVGCDCDRFLELWNLVFMQFYQHEDGSREPLPKPSIDTGLGLERVAAVLQGKLNNFDSDLFSPIIEQIAAQSGKPYGNNEKDNVAMRVIADHARATTFLVADGVLPSNEGRGYVLRRIMRRAIRYGRSLGMPNPFFAATCATVANCMVDAYPHLKDAGSLLNKVVNNEESRFSETLDHGLSMLRKEIDLVRKKEGDKSGISGEFIFRLYDTYGFPVDIVRDVALEKDVSFDQAGFEREMEKARELSRQKSKVEQFAELPPGVVALLEKGKKTTFVGYDSRDCETTVDGIVNASGEAVDTASQGERVSVYCPKTPLYAESGGQIGDQGIIRWEDGEMEVATTRVVTEGLTLHEGTISQGSLQTGAAVAIKVLNSSRNATQANHSATHLLHAAMKEILGEHVKQSGSLVEPNRLRFDFTHFSPLTPEEIRKIEQRVNREIRANTPVGTNLLDREQAIAEGATALFGEKYGEKVRVVSMGGFSKELCGGTHVRATGDIGFFKIISETGIAAGVRRIEAVTGEAALAWVQNLAARASEIGDVLSGSIDQAPDKIRALIKQQRSLEKEVAALTAQLSLSDLDQLFDTAADVAGIQLITGEVQLDSPKTLREIGDKVRDKMTSGVAVLAGEFNGKAALLALVSIDLTDRIKAGVLVGELAKIVGGKGGGRPDMAQAGGSMPDKIGEALRVAPETLRSLLAQ